METFWERVQIFCGTKTIVELSKVLGINRSTLSSWIHSDKRPPLRTALEISRITGVSLEQLEYGPHWSDIRDEEEDEIDEKDPTAVDTIIRQIKQLEPDQLHVVKTLLDYMTAHQVPRGYSRRLKRNREQMR